MKHLHPSFHAIVCTLPFVRLSANLFISTHMHRRCVDTLGAKANAGAAHCVVPAQPPSAAARPARKLQASARCQASAKHQRCCIA